MKKEWHITYLAAGVPHEYHVKDTDYCCAKTGGNAPAGLEELGKHIPQFGTFLAGNPVAALTCISYRIHNEKRQEAIDHTLFKVSAFLDGYSVIKEVEAPILAPIALIREDLGKDLSVVYVRDSGWMHHHSQEKIEVSDWKNYERKLLERILPFFNIASGVSEHEKSEISQQILQSTKAYRAAIASRAYGIEFLCKFAALEGLVCGAQTSRKRQLLETRLGALFRKNPSIKTMVSDLWTRRSIAVHSGQLFHHDLLADSYPLQLKVNDVHYLFSGALVFALDNISVENLNGLWERAENYELPDWLVTPNPCHRNRVAMTLWVENCKVIWNGMGIVTDQFFPIIASGGL